MLCVGCVFSLCILHVCVLRYCYVLYFEINFRLQLSENENNHVPRASKPCQYLKDKSSKRKSSLNRIDFLDYPTCAG